MTQFSFLFILILAHSAPSFAKNDLPFFYLNQYFTFEKVSNKSFNINEQTYSTDDILIEVFQNKLKYTFKNLPLYNSENMQIQILDKQLKLKKNLEIKNLKRPIIVNRINYNPSSDYFICLNSKNEFTTKQVCKKIESSLDTDDVLKFEVDSVALEDVGRIILNNKESQINFKAYNSNYFINIFTKNKNVIINSAEKKENSEVFNVEFVQLNNPLKYNFKLNLSENDTFFKIEIDPLLTVYQDIEFANLENKDTALSYRFRDWKVKHYNKIGIAPIAVFFQLGGSLPTANFTLVSDMGKGFNFYLTHYPDETLEYYASTEFFITQFRNDANATTIENQNLNLFSMDAGLKLHQTPDFNYDFKTTIEEQPFAEIEEGSTSISVVKRWAIKAESSISYNFLSFDKWKLQVKPSIGLVAPISLADGNTKLAFSSALGGNMSYKVREGRFYYSLEYGAQNYSNSVSTFNYQILKHELGFFYLF
jgi:hypothetical protein